MTVGSGGQEKIQLQEKRVQSSHVALLRGKNAVFGECLRRIGLRLHQKFDRQRKPGENLGLTYIWLRHIGPMPGVMVNIAGSIPFNGYTSVKHLIEFDDNNNDGTSSNAMGEYGVEF
ncbi:hypothetical protein TNCV_4331291 [Trichonephila clavipes]|nr:hypothetical protein TNCV_4331291 [Trichonephila clavipes]